MDNKNKIAILALAGAGIGIVAYKARHPSSIIIPELAPPADIVTYVCPACGYSYVGYLEDGDVFCPVCADNGVEVVMEPTTGISGSIAGNSSIEGVVSPGGKNQIVLVKRFGLPYRVDVWLSKSTLEALAVAGFSLSVVVPALLATMTGVGAIVGLSVNAIFQIGFVIAAAGVAAWVTSKFPCGVILKFMAWPPFLPVGGTLQPCAAPYAGITGNLTINIKSALTNSPIPALCTLSNGQSSYGRNGTCVIMGIQVGWYDLATISPGYQTDKFRLQILEGQNDWNLLLRGRSGGGQPGRGTILPY